MAVVPAPAGVHAARVLGPGADGRIRVVFGEVEDTAIRAFGCLVEPVVGDRVLLAEVEGTRFVLAVLDRLLPVAATLSAPGVERLTVAAPRLELAAGDTLALAAARDVTIESRTVGIRAHAVFLVGRLVTLVADHLRSTARRREVVADQIAVQAQSRVVLVRDIDVLEAGTVTQSVAGITSTTAGTAVLVAKEDVRFDGKRVTVG
ncbi:DUF3540 domain-containing protein [Ancylobacter amanitiformis]|uniref:DUF3540 domain-containing protein n=1 Tax=Ancylobacter amanitiformis TaxID=217069 RepID=A0ABU0LL80_9HYPH|nr:DUF3540 domain-containing protein [Ancylobacter amanitiformis]MDQ0509465.1 hypothetical protein [Ancylobacter amanitiformis]